MEFHGEARGDQCRDGGSKTGALAGDSGDRVVRLRVADQLEETTTAYGALINGPIRDKLDLNSGIGALGPFAHANAAIGRAWTLVTKNLANGGIPGDTYMGTMGNMLNYINLIMVENEEASPWEPFHVQKGFKKDENVVSMFAGLSVSAGQVGKGSGIGGTPHFEEQYTDLFSNVQRLLRRAAALRPALRRESERAGVRHERRADRLLRQALYANGEGIPRKETGRTCSNTGRR